MINLCIEIYEGEIVRVSTDAGQFTTLTIIDYDREGPLILANPEGIETNASIAVGNVARDPEKVQLIKNKCIGLDSSVKNAYTELDRMNQTATH